ncbi:UNVERIFIED_CONTAM: hypothetical protein Scaly_1913200 [Sesamum calycinum]|uniref:Retrotransposon Copia-like N-terminal domain-containing protein n=1 Tax=Sesamum calycinum TaxID=2727403 RepID=A0AAW2NIZ4_9LAMI
MHGFRSHYFVIDIILYQYRTRTFYLKASAYDSLCKVIACFLVLFSKHSATVMAVIDLDTNNNEFEKEVLYLHPSGHPGLTLSSSPLDGSNFLGWSQLVYVSLGAKLKFRFINGSFPRPVVGSKNFKK